MLIAAALARTADSGAGVVIVLASVSRFGGPAQGSLILAVLLVPHLLAGPLVGLVTDRARHPGLVHAGFVAGFGAAVGGILSLIGHVPQLVVLVLAFVAGCCGSMVFGGLSSRLDDVVAPENRARVRGLDAATYNVADIFGPAAGAALAVSVGVPVAAVVITAGCLCAAVLLLTVRALPVAAGGAEPGRSVEPAVTAVALVDLTGAEAASMAVAPAGVVADMAVEGAGAGDGEGRARQGAHGGVDMPAAGAGGWVEVPAAGGGGRGEQPAAGEGGGIELAAAAGGSRVDAPVAPVRSVDVQTAGAGGEVEAAAAEGEGVSVLAAGAGGGGEVPAAGGGGEARGSFVEDLRAGFRAIVVSPPLLAVTAATCVATFGHGMMASIAVLLGVEHGHPAGGGLLVTAIGVGALAGSLLMARWPLGVAPHRVVFVCLVVTGVGLAAVPLVPGWAGIVALFAVVGLFDGPLFTSVLQVRSSEAPARVRTQVFTLGSGVKLTAAAIGAAVFAGLSGWPLWVLVVGLGGTQLVAAALGVVLLAWRRRSQAGVVGGVRHAVER
ncbi:MFS transporter [Dactylosporangium sp. NPDC000244]|uniref:MFS transporter n=1 Tax=Dactylosporangium sp. NPDC000244 TaxID=3154365 RepID=UPI00331790BB